MKPRVGPIRVRVHERGDRRLDGILRVLEDAARPLPLPEVLDTLCREIAEVVRADVVSVYLPDDADGSDGSTLVLAATVGAPPGRVGHLRVRPGDGLTGTVAECLRPVSVELTGVEDGVVWPGGERLPAFLGIPITTPGSDTAGVLVLQRREARAFAPAEVALATALAAPVGYAVERAAARQAERRADGARAATTARAARLEGTAIAPGVALGRVDVLPSLESLASAQGLRHLARPGHAIALAFSSLARELVRAQRVLERALEAETLVRLRAAALILDDARFRDRVNAACGADGVGPGLAQVAREYARAPFRLPRHVAEAGPWLVDRSAEIEELCALAGARAAGRRVPEIGAVVVAERLGGLVALAAIARHAVGFVLAGRLEPGALGAAIARGARLPVVADVGGLFAWVRPDDRVLVDGDAGIVRVNPPATAVARFRARGAAGHRPDGPEAAPTPAGGGAGPAPAAEEAP